MKTRLVKPLIFTSILIITALFSQSLIPKQQSNKNELSTKTIWKLYTEAFEKDSIEIIKPYLAENWQLSQMPNGAGSLIMLSGIIHMAHEKGTMPNFKINSQTIINDTILVKLKVSVKGRKSIIEFCRLINTNKGIQIVYQEGRMLDLFQNNKYGSTGKIETTLTKKRIKNLTNSGIDSLSKESLKDELNKIIEGDTINRLDYLGLPSGHWKRTYNDGSFMCEGEYINGLKEGFWQKKYENGIIMYQCHYKEGKYDGPCKNYYSNGNIKDEGNYVVGKPHGTIYKYYENGNLKSIEKFNLGELIDSPEYYKKSGRLSKKTIEPKL